MTNVPVKHEKSSSVKKNTSSPVKHKANSFVKNKKSSPVKNNTSSSMKNRTSFPVVNNSSSPVKHKTNTIVKSPNFRPDKASSSCDEYDDVNLNGLTPLDQWEQPDEENCESEDRKALQEKSAPVQPPTILNTRNMSKEQWRNYVKEFTLVPLAERQYLLNDCASLIAKSFESNEGYQ